MRIEFEVFASLIMRKKKNHPTLFELWDHSLEKWAKTEIEHNIFNWLKMLKVVSYM
jgi:flagellar biosynthesis chaperone FliJ